MNLLNSLRHRFFFPFLIIFLFAGCGQDSAQETVAEEHDEDEQIAELTQAQLANAGIVMGKVEQKQISGTVKVNGVLDVPPQQLISVSAPMGGFLKTTSLLQGSRVTKGQMIAAIENLDFIQLQQDYVEAKSNFELAKADYDRQQQLAKENVNSEKTLQQSKANFANAQAKFSGFREKLKMLRIETKAVEEGNFTGSIQLYSPISGYVTAVNVNIGKFVNPADVLFEIVDTEHLHAELTVFEKDVLKLKIGQKVRFTLANETKERMATVYLIGREIGADRTVRIHCHIDKEDKELLPGMYLMALVETGGALVPALPDEAIVNYQGRKYIFAEQKDNNSESSRRFEMLEIQTGDNELGYTEVVLPEGFDMNNNSVVVTGAYSVLSKLKNSEEEEGHGH
jgi:membrane fusion protein, heavy metal efflux system